MLTILSHSLRCIKKTIALRSYRGNRVTNLENGVSSFNQRRAKQCSSRRRARVVVQRIVLISRGDNTSLRRRVSPLRERERRGRRVGRKEGRNPRRFLQEEGTRATRGRGRRRGLSKFRLNSPRINIRNGAPGCHKLACCPLLSFPDSTICTARPVTVRRKLRLFSSACCTSI